MTVFVKPIWLMKIVGFYRGLPRQFRLKCCTQHGARRRITKDSIDGRVPVFEWLKIPTSVGGSNNARHSGGSGSIDVTSSTRRKVNDRCDVATQGVQGVHLHRRVGQARVVLIDNMKAGLIEKSRTVIDDQTFFEVVLWHLPTPVPGSQHPFKYRLALVVNGECVLRYDNERRKGDHRHIGSIEEPVTCTSLEASCDAFQADMERMLERTP